MLEGSTELLSNERSVGNYSSQLARPATVDGSRFLSSPVLTTHESLCYPFTSICAQLILDAIEGCMASVRSAGEDRPGCVSIEELERAKQEQCGRQRPGNKEAVMTTGRYDLAVIGAGMGGNAAANKAASLGANVAIIEKDKMGGT
jgi:hypothetical protein